MRDFFQNQIPNKFLWTPFLLAAGAAVYFACAWWIFALIAIPVAILCGARRGRVPMQGILIIIFAMFYAAIYTHALRTPIIQRDIRGAEITGLVRGIDYTPDKTRVLVRIPAEQIRAGNGTATVRVNISDVNPNIGDTITANVNLFPPSGKDAPETFDYARWAYFNGITATGFAADVQIISHSNSGAIGRIRDKLHRRANSFLADGLVLGYKNTLNESERKIWTTIGIGHVWSISGFHFTLVAGWLFAIFFAIMRFIPYITRRIPARIPATICAWVGLIGYLLISGAGVASIRAFLMTTLVFMALILGRSALSMRNIAIVFCVIFLANPHCVMQPGFQLSFSAVFGLIWFWSTHRNNASRRGRIAKAGFAIYAAFMTTIIATLFTAPFVAAHFYTLPTYGLIGNMVLLPIFSVLIMPLTLIGVISAVIGFCGPLTLAHHIYDFSLHIAEYIANLPYANIVMPHIPNTAMVMFIVALVCLMLVRTSEFARNYFSRYINIVLCATFIITGIIITACRSTPVFFATTDHELVGFVMNDKLVFNKARDARHKFAFNTWRQFNNEAPSDTNIRHKCEGGVCIYSGEKFTVAYIQKFVPLQKNIVQLCRDEKINYIISYFDIRSASCGHKILHGGVVIYPSGHVRRFDAVRPWNNPRR